VPRYGDNTMRRPGELSARVLVAMTALAVAACGGGGRTHRHLATHAVAASSGVPPAARAETPPDTAESEWVVTPVPTLRELTVVVKVTPPTELQSKYRELAARYRSLEQLFNAAASEGFGSGFIVVRRGSAGRPTETFVVTNRHVVGLASDVTVAFDGGRTIPASVRYVDDRYDLAILSLREPGSTGQPAAGASLDLTRVRDQDAIVASGYPAIDGRPSYQVTRGHVSNERFVLDGDEYVQHTAAIDSGSSGGPLLAPNGGVLGVNTLKIRGREAVGMAVPASAIALSLDKVLSAGTDEMRSADERAQAACESLVSSLGSEETRLAGIERHVGSRLVAANGLSSLSSLPQEGTDWRGLLQHDPTGVFLRALAYRLRRLRPAATQGDRCRRKDGPTAGAPSPSFLVTFADAERRLTFTLEQSRWKLIEVSLPREKGGSFLDSATRATKKWSPRLR
jgi:serine protease Do